MVGAVVDVVEVVVVGVVVDVVVVVVAARVVEVVGEVVVAGGATEVRNGPVISYVRPVEPFVPRCELT